jgi:dienelactone hydrolase
MDDPLDDFTSFSFPYGRWEHVVYRQGEGPPVIVIHEMPGITPQVAEFARRVVKAGFTVFMPSLFGTPGAESKGFPFEKYVKICLGKEFDVLATDESSPIVDWLRGLARRVYDEKGGRGVGVIGMCVTGNFALTMTLDPHVVAPVLAQPALPAGLMPKYYKAVHAAPETLANIRRRHRDEKLKVLGVRFKGDPFCQAARFDTLDAELGPAFERIDIDREFAASGKRFPHSVLTRELIDKEGQPTRQALERVLGFFSERLR